MEIPTTGISAMSLYLPRHRVSLRDWCEWTGGSWDKVSAVVGRSFRVCTPQENVYTMAANSVLRLIRNYGVDPSRIGYLGLGTESSTDNAAGAVIVRGMVDRALAQIGLPRLSRQLEVPEFKHACLGGMYALKSALRYASTDGRDRLAIVVSADVAEYERGTSGEPTQGAGAVAMLVEAEPKMLAVDLARAGSASDYRGPDFRKPFARHFIDGYAENTRRLADFPVFSGKYSTFAYIDEVTQAVEAMLAKQEVTAGRYYRSVRALFFHRPYKMMPIQAMSFLYVRGLARGEHHRDELEELCRLGQVDINEVLDEANSTPDLYGQLLADGTPRNPYEATTALASLLRKQPAFQELLAEKMSLGADAAMDMGNLYSAALPAWLAAGMDQGAHEGLDLTGQPMVAIGYGSGDAAEAIPIQPVEGWETAARKIGTQAALARGAVDLTEEQYAALHDGRDAELATEPSEEFVIARVGEQYDPAFQDLGVEYYEYIG